MTTAKLTPDEALALHDAIHDVTKTSAIFRGRSVPVQVKSKTGLRFARAGAIEVVQQNSTKTSKYARMARAGQRISWLIGATKWGLIVDDQVVQHGGTVLTDSEARAATSSSSSSLAATASATSSTASTSHSRGLEVDVDSSDADERDQGDADDADDKSDDDPTVELKDTPAVASAASKSPTPLPPPTSTSSAPPPTPLPPPPPPTSSATASTLAAKPVPSKPLCKYGTSPANTTCFFVI